MKHGKIKLSDIFNQHEYNIMINKIHVILKSFVVINYLTFGVFENMLVDKYQTIAENKINNFFN